MLPTDGGHTARNLFLCWGLDHEGLCLNLTPMQPTDYSPPSLASKGRIKQVSPRGGGPLPGHMCVWGSKESEYSRVAEGYQ